MNSADVSQYCRDLEGYLCQKNGGHLVRIVGPAFEQVRAWAERGVPLKIARRGIDRCCDRAAARGPRRRPIRIEFCEADILDAFDEWRRAIGVSGAAGEEGEPAAPQRKPPLASHVETVIARLVGWCPPDGGVAPPAGAIDALVGELDGLIEPARRARGSAREAIVNRLTELDAALLHGVEAGLSPDLAARLQREADDELAAFGDRLTPAARAMAARASFLRLLRETVRLPQVAFD